MSDQERLENIEEEYMWNVSQGNAMPLVYSDIEWLIQQAERAIEGEEELGRWLSGRNVAVSTCGEIRGLNEENARLREVLEFYANKENYEMNETVRKQQCLEIMWDRGLNARNALESK